MMTDPGGDVRFLYLVQHGEARAKNVDPERALTEAGRQTVERMARWAVEAGIKVDRIRHSGKRRAEQTAGILADRLHPAEGVSAAAGLGPNDDVQPVARGLVDQLGPLLLVGHLPFLSRLASLLLVGQPDRPLIRFCQGGLVGLLHEEGHWSVGCLIPPSMVE